MIVRDLTILSILLLLVLSVRCGSGKDPYFSKDFATGNQISHRSPNSTEKSDRAALLYKAESLLKDGKAFEAVTVFKTVLDAGTDAWTYFRYGDALANAGRYKDAISAYDCSLVLLPTNRAIVYYNKACAASLGKDRDISFQALKESLIEGYTNFEWMYQDPDIQWLFTQFTGTSSLTNEIEALRPFQTLKDLREVDPKIFCYSWIRTPWLKRMQSGHGVIAGHDRGELIIGLQNANGSTNTNGSTYVVMKTDDYHQMTFYGKLKRCLFQQTTGRYFLDTEQKPLTVVSFNGNSLILRDRDRLLDYTKMPVFLDKQGISRPLIWNLVLAGQYTDNHGHTWDFSPDSRISIDHGERKPFRIRLDPYGSLNIDMFISVDTNYLMYKGMKIDYCGFRKITNGLDVMFYHWSKDSLPVLSETIRLTKIRK